MSEKLITTSYKKSSASRLLSDIDDSRYYVFAGKHTPYAGSDSVIEVPDNSEQYKNDVYRSMVFGKLVTSNNVYPVINRHNWVSNTIFSQYDSDDSMLSTKAFYATVNAGATYHTYKCLYNNNGKVSTIQPDFSAVSADDSYFQTSDGYVWKYMYSISSTMVEKFSTTTSFPIIANTTVAENAINGAIDIIQVQDGGSFYNNYLAGQNRFSPSQLRLDGNFSLYDISSNTSASSSNDFYNGCYIYIKSGPSDEVGQFKLITDYYANSTTKTIVLESPFANTITISSTFDIYPGVIISGDGTETSNAVARAIVNTSSNTVQRIDMLNVGSGYKIANASVYAFPDINSSNADLRVIYSPFGGHGYDALTELNSTSVALNVTFANTEGNTIPDTNDYRTVGIIKDPIYDRVDVKHKVKYGNFFTGEKIYRINPLLLDTGATTALSSSVITDANGRFDVQFYPGDFIYITNDTGANTSSAIPFYIDANNNLLTTVVSVTNSTSMVVSANISFSLNGTTSLYYPRIDAVGTIVSANATDTVMGTVNNAIAANDVLIGISSGTVIVANTIYVSGVAKTFNTFISTYKYVGTVISGTFQEDETIYQDSISTANAVLHSANNGNFYVTEMFGTFDFGKNIRGSVSGAIGSITAKYDPEIVFRSGEIEYLENMSPVARVPGQTETFKLIFEF